ncbi:hypothetical protein NDU88_006047 [Pleurodeles waltl]|uniref:Uncharacterized protein n=1 Tax=Pleurodeles waltl TaxID=8319 RepID=A0AAV7L9A2_PLEWA|nr:hypothetical protein NDU88_006047 [Pleurodeles waltl]
MGVGSGSPISVLVMGTGVDLGAGLEICTGVSTGLVMGPMSREPAHITDERLSERDYTTSVRRLDDLLTMRHHNFLLLIIRFPQGKQASLHGLL